ncbi:hypothetical protein N665_0360s0040 [Sinapis alba]|nr:hypothetical protein N665_0360s0040 [Sinapis alba]
MIIPCLLDDLALRCVVKLSRGGYHGALECVSKGWRDLLRYSCYKARNGWSGSWLFVLRTNGLLMTLKLIVSSFPHQKHVVTKDVKRFDPFKKEWRLVASMLTPRTHFACIAVSGKVYVAGGCNLTHSRGITSAEVYDAVADRWDLQSKIHLRELEAFGYGFAALRDELYVIRGKVLKWEESEVGRFDIVRLPVVRVCNPLDRPLHWRETKPMCSPAGGSITACLEECSLPCAWKQLFIRKQATRDFNL